MGLLSIFGVGEAVSAITAIGNVVDELWTSEDEKLTHQEVLTRLAQQPHLAQVELNKVEAQHRSVFVAGWRPAIGWVCAAGIAYHFLVHPLIMWIFIITWPELTPPPGIEFAPLMTLVLSLLGLGSLRTVEKSQGKAK